MKKDSLIKKLKARAKKYRAAQAFERKLYRAEPENKDAWHSANRYEGIAIATEWAIQDLKLLENNKPCSPKK